MSNIDLYKGDCLEVMDKAKKNFSNTELNILFASDLSQFTSKDNKKFDTSIFKPFEAKKRIEDTVVEKGLFDE